MFYLIRISSLTVKGLSVFRLVWKQETLIKYLLSRYVIIFFVCFFFYVIL